MPDGQDNTETVTESMLDTLVQEASAMPAEEEKDKAPAVDPNDVDAVEEAKLREEIAAEDAKTKAETDAAKAADEAAKTGKDPAAEAQPDKAAAKPGAKADPPAREQIMIPKERFDAEREKLIASAAYWKGRAESGAGNAAQPKAAEPTPAQKLADIDAQRDALAKKVDDGEMTMSAFMKEDRQLRQQEDAIRDAARKPADSAKPKPQSDLYLDTKTEELEGAHPYLAEISALPTWKEDYQYLTRKAVASLAQEGFVLPEGELHGRDLMVLRGRIAELSDTLGPMLTGKTLVIPGRTSPADQGKPGLSKQGQARAAKLDAAAAAPPDLTSVGRSSAQTTDLSEASLMAMSDEELEKLPQSVQDRIMGRPPT